MHVLELTDSTIKGEYISNTCKILMEEYSNHGFSEGALTVVENFLNGFCLLHCFVHKNVQQ